MYFKTQLQLFLMLIFTLISCDVAAFTITSSAFQNNGNIPSIYTCNGDNIIPPLTWHDFPAATQSFAITITDPDAPAGVWTHWVIYNIPARVNSFSGNRSSLPLGSFVLNNSWQHAKYEGPCPPSGVHHYQFTIYALDITLNISKNDDKDVLEKAMKNHILAKATLVGLYAKY